MQNEDSRKNGSSGQAPDTDSRLRADQADSTSPHLPAYPHVSVESDLSAPYHYRFGLSNSRDFAQNLGQDIPTYTATLQQTVRTVEDGHTKDFVAREAEFFLKERDGLVSDTNAKLVMRHVPVMKEGQDVQLLQDLTVGLNANWPGEVFQANLSQAFRNEQNANLAATMNRNGFLIYTGTTFALPDYKNERGNEFRYTGDFQVEVPHESQGISKIEAKGGFAGKVPKCDDGISGDNGYTYRFVAGPAFRSDGVSGLIDGSLRFNETNTFNPVDRVREVEKRSCEFNLTCIIPEHGASYLPEFKAGVGLERERIRELAGQQESKALDRLRLEFLSDANDRHRLDLNYGRVWEKGPGSSTHELNIKGFCEQDQGVLNYGAYLEYRFKWGATSYHQTDEVKDKTRGPFGAPELDRYHGAVRDGNSVLADQLANEFAQSAEGQRMAQQGDRLLAQQQAQESELAQTQVHKGPAMRV